jgi:hypothetical protein
MRVRTVIGAIAILGLAGMTASALAEESRIRVGAIDAVLTIPFDVERPAGCAADRGLRIYRP